MIRAVLFDLSGVLYIGDEAVPGAVDALARLASAKIPVAFVTNVSQKPRALLLEQLQRLGLPITSEALLTAPDAARTYLRAHRLSPYLIVHAAIEHEFSDFAGSRPDAVLLGDAGDGFTHARLNQAFRLMMDGAPLLAMGNNRYFRDVDGLSLDIGPYVAALEYAADRRAVLLGKPAAAFFNAALERLGCSPDEAVMIGDDAEADVEGALRAGLHAILVRTGKYRAGDEHRIRIPGAVVCADVGAAVSDILDGRIAP